MEPFGLVQLDGTRKRGRDDELDELVIGGTTSFSEHRTKRLQALPVRTSPRSCQLSAPPAIPTTFNPYPLTRTITPCDSDSEEAPIIVQQLNDQSKEQHFVSWPSSAAGTRPSSVYTLVETDDVDGDMDMMDTNMSSDPQQLQNPDLLGPGPSQPDPISSNITGRMPTPIHCSFAQQVRGNNWGGAAGNVMQTGTAGMDPFSDANAETAVESTFPSEQDLRVVEGVYEDRTVPRSLDGPAATAAVMADLSRVQNRRLPSPISESGGEDAVKSPVSPGMVLDSSPSFTVNRHGHAHPALASLPPRSSSAMELSQLAQDGPAPDSSPGASAMDVEPASQSPKKGHTRSRHTLNSWTLQPGMKKSFSIGYRADCEKCRMKVPGHFNHIIIS